MNFVKLLLYLVAVVLAIGLLLAFALPLLILWILCMLVEAFFGVKLIDRRFVGRFHRSGRPQQPPSPAPEPEPDVPASEAVIDVVAVDLPDEPPQAPERARVQALPPEQAPGPVRALPQAPEQPWARCPPAPRSPCRAPPLLHTAYH